MAKSKPVAIRVGAKRKQRIREAQVGMYGHRALGRHYRDQMVGQQSWLFEFSERGEAFAHVALHRVPINTGWDVVEIADAGPDIPAGPLASVLNGWDGLTDEAIALLPDPDRAAGSGPRIMVAEQVRLFDSWRRYPDVGALVLATAIDEIQDTYDLMVVADPDEWWHEVGDQITKITTKAEQKRILRSLGFFPHQYGTWVLTDWDQFHEARVALHEFFGINPGPDPEGNTHFGRGLHWEPIATAAPRATPRRARV